MNQIKRGDVIMRPWLSIILWSLSCLVIINCESPTEEDDISADEKGLSFVVQDTDGNPLDSVGIHFYFDFPGAHAKYEQASNNPSPGISSIELSSFTAGVGDGFIELVWATASESNNLGFEVQRSENGGEDSLLSSYTTNNDLVGQGNTIDSHDYSYLDSAVIVDILYSYRLIAVDSSGIRSTYGPVDMMLELPAQLPSEFSLYQNYPNPFNPYTYIRYELPEASHVLLQVLNWSDTEPLRTLVDETQPAGYHTVTWDGSNDSGRYVTNNIYTYRMTAGDFSASKEMCLLMLGPDSFSDLNSIPLAMTDADGNANLDYSILPLDKSINLRDEMGNDLGISTVPSALDFVFLKTGYQSFVTNVSIDTSMGSSHTITLESN